MSIFETLFGKRTNTMGQVPPKFPPIKNHPRMPGPPPPPNPHRGTTQSSLEHNETEVVVKKIAQHSELYFSLDCTFDAFTWVLDSYDIGFWVTDKGLIVKEDIMTGLKLKFKVYIQQGALSSK